MRDGSLSIRARLGFWCIRQLLRIQALVQRWTYRELDRHHGRTAVK